MKKGKRETSTNDALRYAYAYACVEMSTSISSFLFLFFCAGSVPQQICLYVLLCRCNFCCNLAAQIKWKSSIFLFGYLLRRKKWGRTYLNIINCEVSCTYDCQREENDIQLTS